MDKKYILVVDDEEYLIRSIIRAFYMKGMEDYEILVCHDGHEALDSMRKEGICIVLLDINMPNLNGIKVCEEAMRDDHMKTIPILVTSGHLNEDDKRYLKKLGIKHFLDKPYKLDTLFSKIDELAQKS